MAGFGYALRTAHAAEDGVVDAQYLERRDISQRGDGVRDGLGVLGGPDFQVGGAERGDVQHGDEERAILG